MAHLEDWLTERKIGEVECLVPDMSGIARGKILPASREHFHPDRDRRVRRG
jgi:glutamine synthetase